MKNKKITELILGEVVQVAQNCFGLESVGELILETPPNPEWGDFAVPLFVLAKKVGRSPAEIAKQLASQIVSGENIASAEANGPYLNLKLTTRFFEEAVSASQPVKIGKGENVMIEYLSPNTNKPLHLGHFRNGVLGSTMANILEQVGYHPIKTMLVNDRGIHICKSMLAWQKFGEGETPQSSGLKGDHLVGKYYVKFAEEVKKDSSLLEEAQTMLKQWEAGDEEVIALWKKMNDWVYAGFDETLQRAGFGFDEKLYESEIYQAGKEIVAAGLKKGVFQKDENGAVIFELPVEEFGLNEDGSTRKVTVLRADETSVYITQDLALAVKKVTDYELGASIYVVGNEQDEYFKRLFAILQALGYAWASKCHHLSYGMVELTSGKMKSREGTVVDADDLMDKMERLAAEEVKKRAGEEISNQEVIERATKIGLAAMKFFLLKSGATQRIVFDPQESISFEGVTGPYCQYAYARAGSILQKGERLLKEAGEVNFSLLGEVEEERTLAQKLLLFEDNVLKAAKNYNPSLVAMAVCELAKTFNQWYDQCRVVDEANPELSVARLRLVQAMREKIKTGLALLGIEVLEEM